MTKLKLFLRNLYAMPVKYTWVCIGLGAVIGGVVAVVIG